MYQISAVSNGETRPIGTALNQKEADAMCRSLETAGDTVTIVRGWIDASGKCRTWKLIRKGEMLAEVTTQRGALRLLELLNLA